MSQRPIIRQHCAQFTSQHHVETADERTWTPMIFPTPFNSNSHQARQDAAAHRISRRSQFSGLSKRIQSLVAYLALKVLFENEWKVKNEKFWIKSKGPRREGAATNQKQVQQHTTCAQKFARCQVRVVSTEQSWRYALVRGHTFTCRFLASFQGRKLWKACCTIFLGWFGRLLVRAPFRSN